MVARDYISRSAEKWPQALCFFSLRRFFIFSKSYFRMEALPMHPGDQDSGRFTGGSAGRVACFAANRSFSRNSCRSASASSRRLLARIFSRRSGGKDAITSSCKT